MNELKIFTMNSVPPRLLYPNVEGDNLIKANLFRQVSGTNKELSPAARHGYLVSPTPRLTSINSSLSQSLNSSQNQSYSSKSCETRIASDFLSPIAKIFNELKSQGGNSIQLTSQVSNHYGVQQTCDSARQSVNESHNSSLNRNELGFNFTLNNFENSRKSELSETVLKTLDIGISQTASHAPSEFDVRSVGPGEEQFFARKSQQVSSDFRETFDEAFDPAVVKNKHCGFILDNEDKDEESEQLHFHPGIDTEGIEEYSVDDGGDENFILLEENQVYSLDEEDPSGKENKLNGKNSNSGRKKLERKQKKGARKESLVEKEAKQDVEEETSSNEDGINALEIVERLKSYDVAVEKMQQQRNKETVELHKWIIKPVPNSKGVCVEGMKKNTDQFWHSSAIQKRLSARKLLSNSGTVYKLVGNIVKLDALDAGYPIEVVEAFKHGFPKDWQETLQEYCNPDQIIEKTSETSRSLRLPKENHTKNQTLKSPKSSLKRKLQKTEPVLQTPTSSPSTSKFEICTPTGQIINIKNLNRTKSGRLVKPILYSWLGQCITQSGDDIQVTCNTKNGENELSALKDQVKNSKKIVCRRVLVKKDTSFSKNSLPAAKNTDSDMSQSAKLPGKTMNSKSKKSVKVIKEPQEDKKTLEKDDYDVQAGVNDVIQHHKEKLKSKRQPKKNTCYNSSKDSIQINGAADVFSIDLDTIDDFEEEKIQRKIRTTKNSRKSNPEKSENSKSVDRKKSERKRKTSSHQSKQQSAGGGGISAESSTDMKNPAENDMQQSSEPNENDKKSASESNLVDLGHKQITKAMNRRVMSSKATIISNSVLLRKNRSETLVAIPESDTAENGISRMLTRSGRNQSRARTTNGAKRSSESGSLDGTNKDIKTLGNSKSLKRKISGARSNDSKENYMTWQKDEVQRLESAVNELQQGQSGYWETVASLVGTRNVLECQDYYYRELPQPAKKQKKESKEKKKNEKVTKLTGKAGTLKRKNQLRDFLDQQQEGYSEDLFDATPFRNHNKKQKMDDSSMVMNGARRKEEEEDGEGIFDELIKRRSSLYGRFQTPLIQNKNPRFNLASEKKTPAVISNVFTPSAELDRKDADHIIYQFKQKKGPRRLIGTQKKAPKGKKTKVSDIPNRSLFGKSAPDVLQLFKNKQNDSMEIHQDSDEEQDFYWSDQD